MEKFEELLLDCINLEKIQDDVYINFDSWDYFRVIHFKFELFYTCYVKLAQPFKDYFELIIEDKINNTIDTLSVCEKENMEEFIRKSDKEQRDVILTIIKDYFKYKFLF